MARGVDRGWGRSGNFRKLGVAMMIRLFIILMSLLALTGAGCSQSTGTNDLSPEILRALGAKNGGIAPLGIDSTVTIGTLSDTATEVESITGPYSFVFGGQDETYLKIYIAAEGRIVVEHAGKMEDSAKAFFDYLQSNFSFDCPSDAQILDVLRIALRYIDPAARWVTSSTLEYCDDLCQAERAVVMIKNKREFVNRLELLIHKLSGGTKK